MAESVRDIASISHSLENKCNLCGAGGNLKVCAACKSIEYCCREHQTADWSSHKKLCKAIRTAKSQDLDKMGIVTDGVKSLTLDCRMAAVTSTKSNKFDLEMKKEIDSSSEQCSVLTTSEAKDKVGQSYLSDYKSCESETSGDKETDTATECNKEELSGSSEKFILESEDTELKDTVATSDANKNMKSYGSQNIDVSESMYMRVLQSRTVALSENVTKCLNSYGVCVIDNFLGDSKGTDILDEVKVLYDKGHLKSGEVVDVNSPKGRVRGDVISWVNGTEEGCQNINTLISSIDNIMLRCRKTLDHYCVKERSKAMVAVYPGNGTGFLRHVDNPSGDGRCVTCIYYLNKDWNSMTDGGLLRIFPEGQNKVANVEPKFDRLLFFWSDRRNPHEVLPAYRTRYAVTVWYYDQDERKRAVKKFKPSKS